MKSKPKIVLIGAGSAVFGTRLIRDIAQTAGLQGSELVLVDINREKLNVVYNIGKRIIAELAADISLFNCEDYKEALPGADFVLTTVATGGTDEWLQDVAIPRKFGYNFCVADTLGPGGMARAFRTIPLVLEIAQAMRQICPSALLINYSNPMTAICRAVTKYTETPVIGLCHGLQNTVRRIAPRLGYEQAELRAWAAGINHFIWLTDITDSQGNDVYPRLLARAKSHPEEQPLAYELLELYQLLPSGGDDHIIEFVPHFASGDTGKKYNLEMDYVQRVVKQQEKEYARLKSLAENPEERVTRGLYGTSEMAAEIMDCLVNQKTNVFMVNVPNNGKLPGLPNEAIVEIPGIPTPSGVRGLQVASLPSGVTGRLFNSINEFELIVDASVNRSRRLAIQAMLADPSTISQEMAVGVVDALLKANERFIGVFN